MEVHVLRQIRERTRSDRLGDVEVALIRRAAPAWHGGPLIQSCSNFHALSGSVAFHSAPSLTQPVIGLPAMKTAFFPLPRHLRVVFAKRVMVPVIG